MRNKVNIETDACVSFVKTDKYNFGSVPGWRAVDSLLDTRGGGDTRKGAPRGPCGKTGLRQTTNIAN